MSTGKPTIQKLITQNDQLNTVLNRENDRLSSARNFCIRYPKAASFSVLMFTINLVEHLLKKQRDQDQGVMVNGADWDWYESRNDFTNYFTICRKLYSCAIF